MRTTFEERFKELLNSLPGTDSDVAARLGVSKQRLSSWRTGYRSPRKDMIEKIAQTFGVSIPWLMGLDVPKRPETQLGQKLPSDVKTIGSLSHHRIPMIGSVAAGEPIMAEQEYGVYVDCPEKADYALTIEGHSMEPTFLPGDVIYIMEQPVTDYDGQIAVVILDDTATVKHVYQQPEGLLLISDNPAYAPMYKPFDEYNSIRILGKVCGFTRMFN